jgi:1-acyl-sn-glycerol-3-phosphate acyltransferase
VVVNSGSAVPRLGPSVPKRGNLFSRSVARSLWSLTGWHIGGEVPDISKAVLIVAPHTSNWDFLIGVLAMFVLGIRVSFLGKHTLFRWPLGPIMRWLGGLPVDRRSSSGVVQQIVDTFDHRDSLFLTLTPEGTRGAVQQWKTGFYHMARQAKVPILPVSFDYGRRRITFGELVSPSGDLESDLPAIRRLFERVNGKRGR